MNCIWKRSRIASAIDNDEPLPGNLAAHLESCASCRDYYQAQLAVARLLAQPIDDEVLLPETLRASIMREVRQAKAPISDTVRTDRKTSPWLAPLAFASIALVAALFLILRQTDTDTPVLAGDEAPAIGEVVAQESVPKDYIRSWSTAINQPLDNELESVVADARSAVRFLAVNFLPDSETENL